MRECALEFEVEIRDIGGCGGLEKKKDALGFRHVQFGAFIGCPHWQVSE